MAERSSIEWTDHTMNFWVGCTALSPACDHCYAESWAKRTGHPELWAGERRRTSATLWQQPMKWDRRCAAAGIRERVFTNSLADFLDKKVPERWRDDAWHRIAQTPNLDWMILSKRPENALKMLPTTAIGAPAWGEGWPNVWVGVTVEDRARKRRIDVLREIPARVRFLSIEPLLEDLGALDLRGIHLVIVGGESGPNARPIYLDWVRSIRDQCAAAGVAFFFKQWGEWAPALDEDGFGRSEGRGSEGAIFEGGAWTRFKRGDRHGDVFRVGKKAAGRLLDGVIHDAMPEMTSVSGGERG